MTSSHHHAILPLIVSVAVDVVTTASSRTPSPSRTRLSGIPSANGVYAACYDLQTYNVRMVAGE